MRIRRVLDALVVAEEGVDAELQHVLDHAREQHLQQARTLLQAWVRVDLYHPGVEVLVDDEVVAEELEAVLPLHGVDQVFRREHRPDDHLLDRWREVVLHRVALQARVVCLRPAVVLESRVADLVAVFVGSVRLTGLLDRVVGQMSEHVIRVRRVDGVRLTRGAQVALFEEVNPPVIVPEYPAPDVKLSTFD